MIASTLTALAVMSLGAAAQTSTISLFFPDTDPQSLFGSIVEVGSSMTTYAVSCPSSVSSDLCDFPTPITVAEGSGVAAFTVSYDTVTAYLSCSLDGTTTGMCIESATVSLNGTATSTAMTTTLQSGDISYLPVVVTAGLGKVASGSTNTTSGSANTISGGAKTTSGSKSSGAAETGDASSGTSTGGLPINTGSAQWVAGGAVVALVMAAL
ncbi:MAG: hypothetical protein M1834_008258 [Cirrosporium novae-zelandiae]|nr:MAG: hypothetical protein M1834_008258 [Cirrosporium novae-zelandiae]